MNFFHQVNYIKISLGEICKQTCFFLWPNFGHESSLFKQGFPQNLWISSSTQLGEHPILSLNTEEGFPQLETKTYVSYFVYFSGLITINSYFISTTLMNIYDQCIVYEYSQLEPFFFKRDDYLKNFPKRDHQCRFFSSIQSRWDEK